MYRASLGVLEIYGGQESYIFFSGRARAHLYNPARAPFERRRGALHSVGSFYAGQAEASAQHLPHGRCEH